MYSIFGLDQEKDMEVVTAYRNCFLGTSTGQKVLAHMLTELSYFDQSINDQEAITRRNYATRLLMLLGIWDPSGANIPAIISSLANVPMIMHAKKEEERII